MADFTCPQCGAAGAFNSAASLVAVCQYCRSTLLRSGDTVEHIGRMTEAIEDYSPIQLGVTGSYQGRSFRVIGRIQLRYEAGSWNEWYLLYGDGQEGWLSDASGQYTMTARNPALEAQPGLPAFDSLHPGAQVHVGSAVFFASDVRTAQCSGGEGELPFSVGETWAARVADCRYKDQFITLDYSDAGPAGRPQIFSGQAVELDSLSCSGLRTEEQIRQVAGHVRGDVTPIPCPSCGASITFVVGAADFVNCDHCHAVVQYTGNAALVLSKARDLKKYSGRFELGAKATIDGKAYELIGFTRCAGTPIGADGRPGITDEYHWTEYLLYGPQGGFLWLVETDEGWDRVAVLNAWPESSGGGKLHLDHGEYRLSESYRGRIDYAAGAFNWRAQVGDTVDITDYVAVMSLSGGTLTVERSAKEWVWSKSSRVDTGTVDHWFGRSASPGAGVAPALSSLVSAATASKPADGGMMLAALITSGLLVLLNLGSLLRLSGMLMLVPLLAIWAPVWVGRLLHSWGHGDTSSSKHEVSK